MKISRIEVEFAVPVELPSHALQHLASLIDEIARKNTPAGHVHWVSGIGSRPVFSRADAAFLGRPADPGVPVTGEPTFDDSVFHIETACREKETPAEGRKEGI